MDPVLNVNTLATFHFSSSAETKINLQSVGVGRVVLRSWIVLLLLSPHFTLLDRQKNSVCRKIARFVWIRGTRRFGDTGSIFLGRF